MSRGEWRHQLPTSTTGVTPRVHPLGEGEKNQVLWVDGELGVVRGLVGCPGGGTMPPVMGLTRLSSHSGSNAQRQIAPWDE